MFSSLLLVLGMATLSLALRSYRHPVFQKLGAVCVLLTSYLIGASLFHSVSAGIFCASTWFLLPWVELLTRIRSMRIPAEKHLRSRPAPGYERFPALSELTTEILSEGFENVCDAGWDWDEYQQFFRIFYRASDRSIAAICLIEQTDLSFYYLSVTSRGKDGRNWITWNYPFSNSLRAAPEIRIQRVGADASFFELYRRHTAFLGKSGVGIADLRSMDEDGILAEIQEDLRVQIQYNMSKGILSRTSQGDVRYSWRGLVFLWFQTIRDLVRLS